MRGVDRVLGEFVSGYLLHDPTHDDGAVMNGAPGDVLSLAIVGLVVIVSPTPVVDWTTEVGTNNGDT